eukprot:2965603-Prymnesium_polylepis.1
MPRASHRPGGGTRARSAVVCDTAVCARAPPRLGARHTREGIALSGTPLLGRKPSREYSSGSQSCCGGGGA